jgi:hypothetical protein
MTAVHSLSRHQSPTCAAKMNPVSSSLTAMTASCCMFAQYAEHLAALAGVVAYHCIQPRTAQNLCICSCERLNQPGPAEQGHRGSTGPHHSTITTERPLAVTFEHAAHVSLMPLQAVSGIYVDVQCDMTTTTTPQQNSPQRFWPFCRQRLGLHGH